MKKFQKILIANRGEIACRLIQACQELGISTVAVFSEADRSLRHTELADQALPLGGESAAESYLNLDKLLKIAKDTGCDAVHPGYGFISERAHAAEAFIEAGITWIGPTPENIRLLGDKLEAKKILEKHHVPTLPWAEAPAQDLEALKSAATKIGFPLLFKAASGGGGKGMRLVQDPETLLDAAQAAAREAAASFGDATLLIEKYLRNPRHIEVQVLGDHNGDVIHLGERECTAQRRHQKVIEEAPAARLSEKSRARICEAARSLAMAVGYRNAGTVEFLVDEKEDFYFLEVNSRLQVEHPVTELVWGIDLVQAQIKIAQGSSIAELGVFTPRGHAIEARIYAENPAKGFAPSPGTLIDVEWPCGTGIRVESGFRSGDTVSLNYDAMLAKVIAFGADREHAIQRLVWALQHTRIFGVVTNGNYLQDILLDPFFHEARIHVKYLEQEFSSWNDSPPSELIEKREEILARSYSAANSHKSVALPSVWETLI